MKITLFVLFFTNCLIGFAQSEFAPNGAEWYYSYREGAFTPRTGYYTLKSIKDTTIEMKKCKILSRTRVDSKGISFNDGRSIVYHDVTQNIIYRFLYGKFYLLYDFTKVAGDTIIIKEPYSTSKYDSIITIVDSVGIETFPDQVKLKSLYTHIVDDFKFQFAGKITERLGNHYFFFPINTMACDGGCPQPLRCYNDDKLNFRLYQSLCDTFYTSTNQVKTIDITAYPNPFTNSLTIKIGNQDGQLFPFDVFNLYGKSILHDVIPGYADYQINLQGFPIGFYYLVIKINNKRVSFKLLKNS